MKTLIRLRYGILFLLVFAIFNSCEKPSDGLDDYNNSPGSGKKAVTNVSGLVTDENGDPMAGVVVKAETNTTVTNAYGIYIFEKISVNKNRFVVTAKKSGYFDGIRAIQFISSVGSHFGNLKMSQKNLAGNFNSQSGGLVSLPNGSSLDFPANAFTDENGNAYSGNVKVYSMHINQDTPDFLNKIPGGDLRATDANGDEKVLQTFGMMKTDLVGAAGQQLKLAAGKKATLTFSIANSQQSQATASIPLWYLDEKTAIWKEEGTAVKTGNVYTGEVSHFSWWNCDIPYNMCTLNGQVVDCLGTPMANLTILFNGLYTLTTNSQGQYTALWPETILLDAQVLVSMNSGIAGNSNLIQGGPYVSGNAYTLPDLVVPCNTSRLVGLLKDCNGNNVSGYVVITGTQQPTSQYCLNGEIDIQVLPSLPVNIVAYSGLLSGAASAVAGLQGQVVNLGNISLCNSDQQNTVIINGDIYNNQTFLIDTSSTNSIFSPSGPTTGLIISGVTIPQNKQILLQIDFCGSETGNYPLGPTPNCNSDISMILNGVSYYPDDANSTNDFISVVNYGAVGTNIRGTFFTHLARVDTSGGNIPITMSGSFIVPRRQ